MAMNKCRTIGVVSIELTCANCHVFGYADFGYFGSGLYDCFWCEWTIVYNMSKRQILDGPNINPRIRILMASGVTVH